MSSDFYDANSPLASEKLEDKSSYDPENDITLCDSCENIMLVPYKDNKLLCTKCGHVYDPKYELAQVQDSKTTLDELSSRGESSFKDEFNKTISKTLNHKEAKLENQEYVKREFESIMI